MDKNKSKQRAMSRYIHYFLNVIFLFSLVTFTLDKEWTVVVWIANTMIWENLCYLQEKRAHFYEDVYLRMRDIADEALTYAEGIEEAISAAKKRKSKKQ